VAAVLGDRGSFVGHALLKSLCGGRCPAGRPEPMQGTRDGALWTHGPHRGGTTGIVATSEQP
jgi:hypothetical protein